jgi:hypothetical protein
MLWAWAFVFVNGVIDINAVPAEFEYLHSAVWPVVNLSTRDLLPPETMVLFPGLGSEIEMGVSVTLNCRFGPVAFTFPAVSFAQTDVQL